MTTQERMNQLRSIASRVVLPALCLALLASCGDDPNGPPPVESGDQQCCSCGSGCSLTIAGDLVQIPVELGHVPPSTPGGCVGCVGSSVCSSQSPQEQADTCVNLCKGQALIEVRRKFGGGFSFKDLTCSEAAPDPTTFCAHGCDGAGSKTAAQQQAVVVQSLSSASVKTQDEDTPTQLGIRGQVIVSLQRCVSGGCPLQVAFSFSIGGFIITIDGGLFGGDARVEVSAPQIYSQGALDGTLAADGAFSAVAGGIMLRGLRDGQVGSKLLDGASQVSGHIDPLTGVVTLHSAFDVTVKGLTLTFAFDVVTEALNTAPVAVASVPAHVECGVPVLLDGSGTSDPENDIQSARWIESLGQPFEASLGDPLATPGPLPYSLERTLAVGAHDLTLLVVDSHGFVDVDNVQTESSDTQAPLIVLAATDTVTTCTPEAAPVKVPMPTVTDACEPGSVVFSGALIDVNGTAVVPPVEVVAGQIEVPLGTHKIRWRAVDGHGNVRELEDTFSVVEAQTTACCAVGQTQLLGNDFPNVITPFLPGSYCVLARGSFDTVTMPALAAGNDSLFGGPGANVLSGQRGNDKIVGGADADVIRGGASGVLEAYGGRGNDQLFASLASSSTLQGGDGNDLLSGGPGDDVLYPGGGSDLVLGLAGNDVVVIRDSCEIGFADIVVDGGFGTDTLIAPVPAATLASMGVVVVGFENYVVDASHRHLANCY